MSLLYRAIDTYAILIAGCYQYVNLLERAELHTLCELAPAYNGTYSINNVQNAVASEEHVIPQTAFQLRLAIRHVWQYLERHNKPECAKC